MRSSNNQLQVTQIGRGLVPENGGVNHAVEKFSHAFERNTVVSFSYPGEIPDVSDGKIHWTISTNRLLAWYGYAPKANRTRESQIIESTQLIICHVMLRYHANWVMNTARSANLPYWFVPHGQLDPYVYTYRNAIKRIWLHLFGRRLMRQARHVIFATNRETQKAAWFYTGNNTEVVPWPVDLTDVRNKEKNRSALRIKYSLAQTDLMLLYFGRLHSMKNPLKTIEAIARCKSRQIHLLIVGPDGDVSARDCLDFARRAGVADQVHLAGPLYGQEKQDAIMAADAYISLSHRENYNFCAAESLAAGTPVVLSPGNDLAFELKGSHCGIMLKDDSMEEAVGAILEIATHGRELLSGWGCKGREFVGNHFSQEAFNKRLAALVG